MANNSNYFDFLKDFKNPLAGVTDSVTKDLSEGGLNLFGAEVPAEFQAYKNAGLLKDDEYKKAIDIADKKSKRNFLMQGLLGYATQNFDKNYGSAFDPRYLKAGLAAGLPAAQKPFDKLSSNFMNLEKLKEFKRTSDNSAAQRKLMKAGFKGPMVLTTNEDGSLGFDVNYDIVDAALMKGGDINFTKDVSSLIKDKTAMATARVTALKDNYKVEKQGNRVFLIPTNPNAGSIKEFIYDSGSSGPGNWKDTTSDRPYQEKAKEIIATIPDLQAFSTIVKGRLSQLGPDYKDIDSQKIKDSISAVYGKARLAYQEGIANNTTNGRTLDDYGMEIINREFNIIPDTLTTWGGDIKSRGKEENNPYIPKDRKEFDNILKGQWVKTLDGRVFRKGME